MRNIKSSAWAIAILAGAGTAAFAVSTATVSSATTNVSAPSLAVKYHFPSFSFTAGVSTSNPSRPSTFSLSFSASFAVAATSPGIVNTTTGTLDGVTVAERVSYPVPASRAAVPLVGPVALPFASERLALVVAIKGRCFVPNPASGAFVFNGTVKCVTATLRLGSKTYNLSSLLRSITGSFSLVDPAGLDWKGALTATFANPGFTFPVATLGSGGGTSLIIGPIGASLRTRAVTFSGTTAG
jgi:hypothetical protein